MLFDIRTTLAAVHAVNLKKKMHNTMDTNSVKKGFALLKRNPILVIIVAFKRMNNSIHYIRLGENVSISHFEAD